MNAATFADGRVSEAIVLSSSAGCPQRLRRGAEAGERGEPLGRDLGLRAFVLLHDFVIENVHADALKLYNDYMYIVDVRERECSAWEN